MSSILFRFHCVDEMRLETEGRLPRETRIIHVLTRLNLDKVTAISQTALSNVFSWKCFHFIKILPKFVPMASVEIKSVPVLTTFIPLIFKMTCIYPSSL